MNPFLIAALFFAYAAPATIANSEKHLTTISLAF